jgi:hypothetical protein
MMLKVMLAVSAVVALAAPLSQANDSLKAEKNNVSQACQNDIRKYCGDVTDKGSRIMQCLSAHDDKLSDTCTTQWKQAQADWHNTMKSAQAACSGDVQKFCSNIGSPKDIKGCLNDHSSDLSSSCKDFRSKNDMNG